MPKKPLSATQEESFVQRLIRIRKAKNMSQKELADLIGVSPRVMAYYETETERPPATKLVQLAKALKVSLDELMGIKSFTHEELVKNKKILKKMKELDQLPPQDQKAVFRFIDALMSKHNMAKPKAPVFKAR